MVSAISRWRSMEPRSWYHSCGTSPAMATSKDQPPASASEAVTNDVRVEVELKYLPANSLPFQGQWAFAYTVRLPNEGTETVKFVSRHWIVTDASDLFEEIKGEF